MLLNATSAAIRPGSLCPQASRAGAACTPHLGPRMTQQDPASPPLPQTPSWSQRAKDGRGLNSGTLPVPRKALQTHLVTVVFIKGFLSQK